MSLFPSSPVPTAAALLLAVPLWLVACHDATDPRNRAQAANAVPGDAVVNAVRAMPDRRVQPHASDSTPPDAQAMKGREGARSVLNDWAQALERRDWDKAWAQWGHGGADSGLDPAAFARAYEKYASITVSFGDGDVEGGAGSLYYQVPVTIGGTLKDGRPFHLEGPVTLRRVNDVDGATPQELAWHIGQSDLKPRP